jgi:N-glycosylase/DNA lyase
MKSIIQQIKQVQNSETAQIIEKRLKQFKELNKKSNEDWFSELCFCILTANSKAKTALNIQKELGKDGFLCHPQKKVCECIKRNKHRFHNNKSKFIVLARSNKNIKDILKNENDPREWLVKNIKGLGFKESSHFLRNVGYEDYAIVDRHILNVLKNNNIIKEIPKPINKKTYLSIEDKLKEIGKKINMNQAKLDLYLWYIKTGEVLK